MWTDSSPSPWTAAPRSRSLASSACSELRFFSRIGYGGGAACATVQHAAMAVATGIAEVVVCYRALNERSGRRFGRVEAGAVTTPTTYGIDSGWHYPMGIATPAATVAMARPPLHARPTA